MPKEISVNELTTVLSKFPPDHTISIYADYMQDVQILVFPPGSNRGVEIWNSFDGLKEIN